MPRLFRESPLNGVWEGSGNVICLDVLRACRREPESLDALLAEIRAGSEALPELSELANTLALDLQSDDAESQARVTVERLAIGLQASLLARFAPASVSDAFASTRLRGEGGRAFGALPRGIDVAAITARATPAFR